MDSAGASQKQIARARLMLFWFAIFETVLLLASWYYKPTCWPTSNKFVNFFLVWNCNHFLEYDHIIFFLLLFSSRFDSLLFPFTVGNLHFIEKQSHEDRGQFPFSETHGENGYKVCRALISGIVRVKPGSHMPPSYLRRSRRRSSSYVGVVTTPTY